MRTRVLAATILFGLPFALQAQQGRGQGPGRGAEALNFRTNAPVDLTGYWVSLITDDWRYRMLTPPKGNVDYLPMTAEARRLAEQWDPVKDEAAGEQCRGYGAVGVMRLPGRLHITWESDTVLKLETDAGTQRADSSSALRSPPRARRPGRERRPRVGCCRSTALPAPQIPRRASCLCGPRT